MSIRNSARNYIHAWETFMKINTEFFPVRKIQNNEKAPNKEPRTAKPGAQEDIVTISADKSTLIAAENKEASQTALLDFKQAEERVADLKSMITEDTYTAADVHQLEGQRILFLSLT